MVVVGVVLVLGAMSLVMGCASTVSQGYREVGVVALSVPLESSPGADVEVLITARDMDSPIVAQLDVDGRLAWGAVDDVDAGEGRHVIVTYTDRDGRHCGATFDVDIPVGHRTEVEVEGVSCGGEDALRVAAR